MRLRKTIILIILALAIFTVGCAENNIHMESVTPTLTPISVDTSTPSITREPTPVSTVEETPTPVITNTPTPRITPAPTPMPTINPEQKNIEVETIICNVGEYDFWLEDNGDYVKIWADGDCYFARIYVGDTELNIDYGYFGSLGPEVFICVDDFPINQFIDITIEYYDENCFLTQRKIIPNVYLGVICDGSGETLSISDISKVTDIEHLSLIGNITGDINELKTLKNLHTLDIEHCSIVGDISVFSNLSELVYFRMYYTYRKCMMYGDISVFENCQKLEKVYVIDCTDIYGDASKLEEMGVEVYIN